MNQIQPPPAVCEIELSNGHICGVAAIGRCTTCGRAFCASHQGRSEQIYYVDQCAPCFAHSPMEVSRTQEKKRMQEIQDAQDYFSSGVARTALLTAGVPLVDIYVRRSRWKTYRVLFGRTSRYVDEVTRVGRGWILGKFKWSYDQNRSGYGGEETKAGIEDWLTALLDLPEDFQDTSFSLNCGLARVQPCSEGYEYLDYMRYGAFGVGYSDERENWLEVVQTVKRLVKSSS
jgi:hypothetical protein